jgi:RibD C-terminal domain
VVWSATISLDGFIAGQGDAMRWIFDHSGPNPVVDRVMRDAGAVLAGRRSYHVGGWASSAAPFSARTSSNRWRSPGRVR